MELIIKEFDVCIKPRLCLNMIVKNESHIIENTLDKLLKKIPFDYWVISDTGSTDNTKEIISKFFTARNIPGELFDDKWEDFGHNRTIALEHAYGKSDYILVFDADDEICGNFILPELIKDSYSLQFGDANGTSYTRLQIVTNHKKWKYIGVLHELIECCEHADGTVVIRGDYYTISGRTSDRNRDENKYLKDALILEKAYNKSFAEKDAIYNRYGFYCANSYYDAGKYEQAIKWFKITLDNNNWTQEKYVSCLRIYNCYSALKQNESGLFYLVKAFSYDKERVECLYELVSYYCGQGMNDVAHGYYTINKAFYSEKYLTQGLQDKLFLDVNKAEFFLPYYMIIVCDRTQDLDTAIQMYKIVFTKKYKETNHFFIGNLLYNLQFFIEKAKDDTVFIHLFKEYVKFLISIDYPIYKHEFMANFEKYGIINTDSVISVFKKEEYFKSKKILIYTGYMNFLWNDSTVKTQSIGGAEKAVVYLSRQFPKDYDIYVVGDQLEEQIDNIRYINRNKLQHLLNQNEFHTIIISRYISFFEEYNNIKCFKLLLYAHDSTGFINNYNRKDINYILEKYNDCVDRVVCLTNWHSNNIIERHPFLKDKIEIINNGINIVDFPTNKIQKFSNKFVWSSCAYRGLHILLNLWSDILEILPDATLDICSYDSFPKNKEEEEMLKTINMYESITYRGKLNTSELYDLMAKSEYWLYTNTFPETSCITGMEMLMSEVICIYYPLAGLVDTVGDYGIPVERGQEIETIVNLTNKRKTEIRKRGKEYALSCSWENRAKKWVQVLSLGNKRKWAFYCSPNFETKMIKQYIDNLNNIYPEHYIYLTNNKDALINDKPHKITFVYEIFDTNIFECLPNTGFSLLNTEPLNIPYRLQSIKNIQNLHHGIGYFDYSESNLHILNENGIDFKYKTYLPYICGSTELLQLQKINKNTQKVFDFGIIKTLGGEISPRRQKIVDFLTEQHFSINVIEGWTDDRDNELAKCKLILNIHGNLYHETSMIFEHIRCDRLLAAGFNILSEGCNRLSIDFIQKYPNLKLIDYDEFFNVGKIIDCYNNILSNKEHNQYVLDILYNTHFRLNIPQPHIKFLEKLHLEFNNDNMVIYDIGSSVLHWSQNAKNIWKNSKIYLFDGMTEMKLFYDEYNNKNNTTYEYNVGVLCDEDYKRISFYQSDELSGGNSYYKEIGHPDSHTIFTENNIKQKIGMKLETIVEIKNIPLPDLIKIDVQGAELDILKGSMKIINNAKFLIVELQHTEYNKGAPLCDQTRDFLIENGWEVYAEKFSNNGPDADWCFINKNYKSLNLDFIQNQPKIIDCFIFYNELELLKYRLTILNEYVDYFVIVESTHTFVGKEKPLFYQENKELFKEFNHKIIHIIVEDFSHKFPDINIENGEQWNNERFQRNCIKRGLDKLKLNDDDIFTITDLDEIPHPKLLQKIKAKEVIIDANIIELDFYYYNLNCKMDHQWRLSKMISYKKYKELGFSCEQIRQNMSFKIIENAGWHLSYFGDEKFIKNKIENFGHQEYNNDKFTDEEKIKKKITSQTDLYGRPNAIINVPIEDNDNLPLAYDKHLTNYYTNNIQNIKSNLIKYSNLRDDTCRFENYDDYINWQTKIGLSFEKDNNKWMNGQRKCVEQNFDTMDRNSKILDICCGDGQGLKKFKEMGFKNVYGVEVCKDKINLAKQYGYTIYDCDICSGPFDVGDNYDCIYSSHTIEHVLNPEYTIRNIMSKLKDNGTFILILPYPDYWAGEPLNEHSFKVHCGVIPLGLHINDNGFTVFNTIRQMGYKITDYKFESYREPEIQLIITK